jgi:hypothetical protein
MILLLYAVDALSAGHCLAYGAQSLLLRVRMLLKRS